MYVLNTTFKRHVHKFFSCRMTDFAFRHNIPYSEIKKKIIIEVRYELNVNYLAIILEHIYLFHMYMQYIIVGPMIGNIKIIANFLR